LQVVPFAWKDYNRLNLGGKEMLGMAIEAYVLIKVSLGKTMEVVQALVELEGVRSVHSVTGPYDVIAAVGVADLDHLGSLMSDVHSVPGIERTTTCIAVTLAKKEEAALPWETLRTELMKRKASNEPVRTLARGLASWIDEVGDDYVVVRPERTGRRRRITKAMIESSSVPSNRIIAALRQLGGYL
jgi:hypothetical protein